MKAKIFESGNSHAVGASNEFGFDATQADKLRCPDGVMITSRTKNLGVVFELARNIPSDFMADGCFDDLPQERETFE